MIQGSESARRGLSRMGQIIFIADVFTPVVIALRFRDKTRLLQHFIAF